uniref:ZM domain-containing protein n=1 Tax=Glossina austeni TaxID=7395 RepID=A0A1A9VT89_GLOAU
MKIHKITFVVFIYTRCLAMNAQGGDGSVKSIVNKQYNSPVGIYSDESIAETLSAQAEVLAGGVLGKCKAKITKFLRKLSKGIISVTVEALQLCKRLTQLSNRFHNVNFKKNEKEYHAEKSEVLKLLREEESGKSTPAFNIHPHQEPQQQYQQQHQQQHYQPSFTRHVSPPISSPKPPSTGGLPTGQNICSDCERLIT